MVTLILAILLLICIILIVLGGGVFIALFGLDILILMIFIACRKAKKKNQQSKK